METPYLIVFSVIAAVFLLGGLLALYVVWIRLNELEDTAPPSEIQRALAMAEGASGRVDAAVVELGKFREGVHSEVQRLYGIMRRQEKAAERIEQAESTPDSEPPDEIDPNDLKPSEPTEGVKSKAELRRIAREKGISI